MNHPKNRVFEKIITNSYTIQPSLYEMATPVKIKDILLKEI
jgi:hypothetical protein